MKQIEKVIHGLLVFQSNGYENVVAADGVIYVGDGMGDDADDFVSSLGWEYDEDNQDWYFLLDRAAQLPLEQKTDTCPTCKGENALPARRGKMMVCPTCDGGQV